MLNRNGNMAVSHLGPPSPTTPTTPTTPTALVPASRDFLVPIGSTGALQKFSVANAAQKRKTVADRRAQAQAHMAATEAGWSSLETANPAPRAASSLGVSSHSNAGYGFPQGLPNGLAPSEVYHRPSSATGYSPKSSVMTTNLSLGPSGSSRQAAQAQGGVSRMRTASSNSGRPSTAGAWMESENGSFRPSHSQQSNASGRGQANSGTASPSEKKRTFSKGLRGLFSSGSSRKASLSGTPNSAPPPIPQPSQPSSSSFWSPPGSNGSLAYKGNFTTVTESPQEAFLERERRTASNLASKPLPPPGGSHAGSHRSRNQSGGSSAYGQQPPLSTLGPSGREGDLRGGSGSSHIRRESEARRADGQSQRSRSNTQERVPIETESNRSRVLSTADPFSRSPRSTDDDQASMEDPLSSPRTPQFRESRRQSTGPPKLDFDLPSPGFSFDEHEHSLELETSPRSQGRVTSGSQSIQDPSYGGASDGDARGGVGDLAKRRSIRAATLGKQGSIKLDSLTSPSSSAVAAGDLGARDSGAEPRTKASQRSSDSSTSSIEFQPGPGFGQHDGGAFNAPALIRSPPTPVAARPSSAVDDSPHSTPPTNSAHRSSVSSSVSQATSIAALTQGWQVEPDVNPPLHPSTVYGPRHSSSLASLQSQESGRSRRTAAVSSSVLSDGRASVASTVIGRSNAATPLGRPFSSSTSATSLAVASASPPEVFGPTSPNPLLAPLFENLPGSGSGTDDGAPGMFRSRHGSFDSGTHGHSSILSHGNQANSTIGHGTLGHGTPAAALLGRPSEDGTAPAAAGPGSSSPGTSIASHQASAASWTTASSGGHGRAATRRPGSSGGAVVTKAGRPTTPRGGVAASAEQPPSALRTVPSSHSRSASLTGSPLTGATRLDVGAVAAVGADTPSTNTAAAGVPAAPSLPSRSKDRPRPSTAGSAVGSDSAPMLPLTDPAMLATLAKLENSQARSAATPLNFSTFSEADLRDALANGRIDLDGSGSSQRPGREASGSSGASQKGDKHSGSDRSDGHANGGVGLDVSADSAADGASLAEDEARDVQENVAAKPAMLNGLPVPEDADPKTYVPSNALTRTRRGAQVGAAAAKAVEAMKVPLDASGQPLVGGRSPGRFSLDSDDDDDVRHRGELDATTPTPTTPTPAASGFATTTDVQVTEEEDLSSGDGLSSDEDDSDLGQGLASNRGMSTDSAPSRVVTSSVDSQMPANAWVEVESALKRFRDDGNAESGASSGTPTPAVDKGGLLRSILLPFLALEVETPSVEVAGVSKFRSGKARRALFFEWIRSLLVELQQTQTSADRGAILESIGCVLESRNLGARILDRDEEDLEEFNSIFTVILGWAIGELNKKGVYQNTLIFTGRLLAIAFFRIHGVASKLLRALPVNRFALERVSSEADWDLGQPRSFERYRKRFPVHLRDFCFQDARSYLKMLDGQTPPGLTDLDSDDDRYLVRQDEIEVEMAGNWLRRWQSDDSELFFSFIRSYHRQMSTLLTSTKRLRKISKWFFGGPGYAHLATSVHQKCLSMVHREIFSVTTLSSQKTFNPGDTANVLSGSTAGKPRHLEAANRRCTAIVVEIARTGHPNTSAQLFSNMLGVHVKSVVKRTSLYDAEGVFCLLDWLDGIISHMDAAELPVDTFLDVDFLIDMVSMLLNTADHALALMRTIAFCYSNFAVLTSHKDARLRFCERILLEPVVFHKLFLSWSVTIRAYFLHLLVFRLARISDFPNPKADPNGKTAVRVARLFNQRLDDIRRRYEELSPSGLTDPSEDDSDEFARFKNRPASFVSTIKHTPSVHRPETMSKAERILGIGLPDPAMASKGGADSAKQSLAAKWLRGLGAKGKKNRWSNGKAAVGMSDADNPTINNEPRKKMMSLDELDFDDVEGDGSGTEDEAPLGGEGVNGADSVSDARAMAPAEGSAVVTDPDIGLGDNITPDASFDLQSAAPSLASGSGRPGASPRVSRAFSKRSSILPGPAFDLVGEDADGDTPPVPPLPAHLQHPYDKTLHTYAVQSLTEYERTIQEHDQYFGAQPESEKAQVPRLQVNWPAMWQD